MIEITFVFDDPFNKNYLNVMFFIIDSMMDITYNVRPITDYWSNTSMKSLKRLDKQQPSKKKGDSPLFLVLGSAMAGYYVVWAIIAALFGKGVATWLATPLWGVPIYIITRWDKGRKSKDKKKTWREFIRFPKIDVSTIAWAFLIMFMVQVICGFLFSHYLMYQRPDLAELLPDDAAGTVVALVEDPPSLIMLIIMGFGSYFCGGWVAGKISALDKLPAYTHAIIASFCYYLVNMATALFLAQSAGLLSMPDEEEVGWFFIVLIPYFVFSLLGAWVAVKQPLSNLAFASVIDDDKVVKDDTIPSPARKPVEKRSKGTGKSPFKPGNPYYRENTKLNSTQQKVRGQQRRNRR